MKKLLSRVFGRAVAPTLLLCAAALPAAALDGPIWDRWSTPPSVPPGQVDPHIRPYGPGIYMENGVVVYAPANCYVSREQVLQNGALVWRPLRTCPSPGYR